MKKFSQIVKESKLLSIQDDSIGYLSVDQIKKYLSVANKFLSDDTKNICKWLIENNVSFKDFPKGKSGNPLLDFYNGGVPKKDDLKELYKWIGNVSKSGRLLEIPVFQTEKQFNDILDKKTSVDYIIYDFKSEKGRNEVAIKYTPLVHKICNSWKGKSSLDDDELFAWGMRGLTYAMNYYGEYRPKTKEKVEQGIIPDDKSKYFESTFLEFASQIIRNSILDGIKDFSRLVRIPISKQRKEKEENGYIAKSNSVSGDKKMGGKDGDEGKSLFDLVGGMENPGKNIDRKEIEDLWDEIMNDLKEHFSEKTMDIFCNHFGFGLENGEKKKSGKEMAEKYGFSSPSSITAEVGKVLNFIKKDKDMFKKFVDIFELMQEAKHDEDEYENDDEPVYVSSRIMEDKMNGLNDIDGND